MSAPKSSGFSLIELLITVAVISILAAIAYPSCTSYIQKGRRGEAKAVLQDLQLRQEKWRANHNTYGSSTDIGVSNGTYYNYAVSANTATTYTLQATAQGNQASDKEGGVACSPLSLNQSNTKLPAGCW
jgi:type IV pilus assembly protein PilE